MRKHLLPPWAVFDSLDTAMPLLVGPTPNAELVRQVEATEPLIDPACPRASDDQKALLRAGLWLLADDLPAAHGLCQTVATPLGSAWHAALHRREGDFSNSLYWWRQAQGLAWVSPQGQNLADEIGALLEHETRNEAEVWRDEIDKKGYDPAAFVRRVEADHKAATRPWLELLLHIQRLEWVELFVQSWRAAVGEVKG